MVDDGNETVLRRSQNVVYNVPGNSWQWTSLMEKMLVGDLGFSSAVNDKAVVLLNADVQFCECQTEVEFVGLVRSEGGDELGKYNIFYIDRNFIRIKTKYLKLVMHWKVRIVDIANMSQLN